MIMGGKIIIFGLSIKGLKKTCRIIYLIIFPQTIKYDSSPPPGGCNSQRIYPGPLLKSESVIFIFILQNIKYQSHCFRSECSKIRNFVI